MKTLVIIDGKSVFYRGYFAMGALSTSDGTPTSGVYGFATIAIEIVKKLKPNQVVVQKLQRPKDWLFIRNIRQEELSLQRTFLCRSHF